MLKKKLALVIGWGSVKCAAALGLLRELNRAGIELDLVVGSGGGAIFASLIAMGYNAEQIIEMNARLWTHEVTGRNRPAAVVRFLMPSAFKKEDYYSFKDDEILNQRLSDAFGTQRFQDTKIPLYISTTDYLSGERFVLSEGQIYDAVRASVALPMIFPPVPHDDKLLVDGFLSDPFPVGVAVQEGADIILAMGFNSVFETPIRSIADYVVHISGILSNNLFNASYAFNNLAHHSEIIPIVPDLDPSIRFFDTERVPEIIEAGAAEGRKNLPFLKAMLEEGDE